MNISSLINKPLKASQFKHVHTDKLDNLDFDLIPYPRKILYSHLNENTVVAVNLKNVEPDEFYLHNEKSHFLVDASIHPRKITILEKEKEIFYCKLMIDEIDEDSKYWSKFTINIFKNQGELSGAIEHGNFSPMMIDLAFQKLEELLKKMKCFHDTTLFKQSTYGSTSFVCKFLRDEPFQEIDFETKGISFKELNNIVELIYNDIPANKK